MKKIMTWLTILLLLNTPAVFGVSDDTAAIAQLRQEMQELRTEVKHLKKSRVRSHRQSKQTASRGTNFWNSANTQYGGQGCLTNCENSDVDPTETGFSENSNDYNNFARMWGTPRNILLLAAAGSTVTTSPFLGLRSAFDASDLIVNLPTMNEDLRFLKEHVKLRKKLDCYGIHLPDRPIIELGGKIEGLYYAQQDWRDGPTNSDIDLACARLDVLVQVSHCVHAFMALSMDTATFNLLNNSDMSVQLTGGASRVFNSRVFVSRAFVTIGDLDYFPIYGTIGQMFVPFGRYASNMVSTPLTVNVGRINERAGLLGYYQCGWYASVYAFKSENDFGRSSVNNGGVNLGYEKTWQRGSLNIGAGYVGNIADATGFQITGGPTEFFGFGLNSNTEMLADRVPALDVHAELAFGKFNLFAEHIAAQREFAYTDLRFNRHGAKPSASNIELAYNFKISDYPASIAAGYGTTAQAAALGLPKNSTMGVFNISLWKNTIESVEFRHDNNYSIFDTYGGPGGAVLPVVPAIGGSRNAILAQVGVYF